MWECSGGWCDLRLCAIWSSKVKRLNTARHWVICFLITPHLMWISFLPLKEHEGTCKPRPFQPLLWRPPLLPLYAHTRRLCVATLGLSSRRGGGWLGVLQQRGLERGKVGLRESSLWGASRRRFPIPGVVQTLPFRIKETWKRHLMFKGLTLLSTAQATWDMGADVVKVNTISKGWPV